ncbi:MAG TPA: hypothetical protein DEA08_10355, partial [Planctomycetes bacterium]|nr:hypothetical protein [Planctomycetota bacterium]
HEGVRPFRTSQVGQPEGDAGARVDVDQTLSAFLAQQEEAYLETLLRETRGSLAATADRADVDPRTLRRKLKRHGIDRTRFLH